MQEVIVYRNPAEAAFWSMMTDGSMVPIAAGALAAVVVFLLTNRVLVGRRMFNVPAWKTYTAFALAGAAWILVARYLWV